jgi:hypothetical protein
MEPVFPDIAHNASIMFEYECVYDYSKLKYFGKQLTENNRVSLYGLQDKVENLSLLQGASVVLNTRRIYNKTKKEVFNVSDEIIASINDNLNTKLSRYKNFSEYCDNQITYSKLDPVITENTVRNGKVKGVYNTIESYDASGGILNRLTQLTELDKTLTLPKTDVNVRYYSCRRNNGKIGNDSLYVTLGYDSKYTIDCSETFFNLSAQ